MLLVTSKTTPLCLHSDCKCTLTFLISIIELRTCTEHIKISLSEFWIEYKCLQFISLKACTQANAPSCSPHAIFLEICSSFPYPSIRASNDGEKRLWGKFYPFITTTTTTTTKMHRDDTGKKFYE